MPDESCRKCGGILKGYSLCAECKKITSRICTMCGIRSVELIHNHCFLLEDRQSRIDMIEDTFVVTA